MRHCFFILIMLFTSFVSAQDNDELKKVYQKYYIYDSDSYRNISMNRALQTVYLGDLNLIKTSFTMLELAILNKNELKYLRNLFFAKYGYRFQSSELLKWYKQFPWYKDSTDNANVPLAKDESKAIEIITCFENPTNIDKSNDTIIAAKLIGLWHNAPMMPSGPADRFSLYKDMTFVYNFSSMDCGTRVFSLKGKWKIDKGILILMVKEKAVGIGGYISPAAGSCGSDYELINARFAKLILDQPEIYRIPVGREESDRFPKRSYGGFDFWKWSDNPDTKL